MSVDQLIDSFNTGRLSRRDFIRGLTLLGVGTAGISTILAACGASSSPPAAASGATGGSPWAADPKSLTGSIKLYKGPFIQTEPDFQKMFVDRFHQTIPNVQVEVSQYDWTTAEAQITASLANGDHDIVYIPQVFYGKYPKIGGPLEDLEPYFADPAWKALTANWFDSLTPVKPPGGILGAAIWGTGPQSQMFINLDLFEKAGVDPNQMLTSYDTLTDAAKKIRALGPDIYGIGMRENGAVNFGWFEWYGYMLRAGTDFLNADWTAPAINTPEFAAALQLIQDWHKNDLMPPFGKYDWPALRGQWTAGKIGIMQEEFTLIAVTEAVTPPVPFKYTTVKFPPGPKADVLFANSAQFVMSNKSQNKQAAWEAIKSWSVPLKEYVVATGSTVPMKDWKAQGWFSDSPIFSAQEDLIQYCHGPIAHPQLLQFKTICEPYFDDVYAGKKTPQDALDAASKDIAQALKNA